MPQNIISPYTAASVMPLCLCVCARARTSCVRVCVRALMRVRAWWTESEMRP